MDIKSTAKGIGNALGSLIDYSTLARIRKELDEAQPAADAANRRVADLKAQINAIERRLY